MTALTGTTLSRDVRFGVAYMIFVTLLHASTWVSSIAVSFQLSWTIETIFPSFVAPIDRFCLVAGRPPRPVNVCGRVSETLTGRPSLRDATQASPTWGCAPIFDPKPPPTYGDITRTSSIGMPSHSATTPRAPPTHWLGSHTVILPFCHDAMVAWGSSGTLYSRAVV